MLKHPEDQEYDKIPKLFWLVLIAFGVIIIFACSCTTERNRVTKRDRLFIDGDELPGIGADKQHPDTCIAYYDVKTDRVYISYIIKQH